MFPSSYTAHASLGGPTSSSSFVMLGQNEGGMGTVSSISARQFAQNSEGVLLHTSSEVGPTSTAAAAAPSAVQNKPSTYMHSGGAHTAEASFLLLHNKSHSGNTNTSGATTAATTTILGGLRSSASSSFSHNTNTKSSNNTNTYAAGAMLPPPHHNHYQHQTTELSVLRDLLITSGAVDAISLLLSVQFCLDYIHTSTCTIAGDHHPRIKNEFMRAVACVLSVVASVKRGFDDSIVGDDDGETMSQARSEREEREEGSVVGLSFPMVLFASRVVGECVALSEEAACRINELLVFAAKKREKLKRPDRRGGRGTREGGDTNYYDNNNINDEDKDCESDDNAEDSTSVVFASIFAAQSSKMSWHLAQLISESLVPLVHSTITNDQPSSGTTSKAHPNQQQWHGGAPPPAYSSSSRSWRSSRFYSEAEPPRVPLSAATSSSSASSIPIQSSSSSTGQYSSNSPSAPATALSILDDFIVLCCSDRPMVERQIASHAIKRFIEPFVAVHLTSICESEGTAAFLDIIATSGVTSELSTSSSEKADRRRVVATADDDKDNDSVHNTTIHNTASNNTKTNNNVDGHNNDPSLAQALRTIITSCWGSEFCSLSDSMLGSCLVGTCSLRGKETGRIEVTSSDNTCVVFGGVFYPLLAEIYSSNSSSSSSVSPPIPSSAVANNTAALAGANAPHNNNHNNNSNNNKNNYTSRGGVAVEALSKQLASLLLTMLLESSGAELDARGEERKQLSCGGAVGTMSRRSHRHCSPTPLTALISLSRMLIINGVSSPREGEENEKTQHVTAAAAAPALVEALLLDSATTAFDMFLMTSALSSSLLPSDSPSSTREDTGKRDGSGCWVPPLEDLGFVSCGCEAIDCVVGGNSYSSDNEWARGGEGEGKQRADLITCISSERWQSGAADGTSYCVFGGRGFKRGQITEIYGEAGSGKTQIGLHTIVYNASLVVRTTKRDKGGATALDKKKVNDAVENEEQATATTAAEDLHVKRHGAIYLVSEDVPQRRIRQFAEYFSRDRGGVWTRSEAAIRETLDAVFIRKVPDLEALIDVLDPSSLDSFVRERNVNVIVVDSIAACVQGTRNNNISLGNDDGFTVGGRRGRRTREGCDDDEGQGDEEHEVGKKHRQWQQQGGKGGGKSWSSNFFASSQPSRALLLERAGAALISAAARLNIAVVTINQVRADTNSGDSNNNNDGTTVTAEGGDRRSSALLPALGWRWTAIVKNRFHLSRDARVPVCVVPLARSSSFSHAHAEGGDYCSEGGTRGAERQLFAVRKHSSVAPAVQTLYNSTVPSPTALTSSSQPLRSLVCVYSTHRPSGAEGCFAIAPECLVGVSREDLI